MAYDTLDATESLSASRAVLNGVTTRTVPLDLRHDSSLGSAPNFAEDGVVFLHEFAVSDQMHGFLHLPPGIARDTNATLSLFMSTRGAEASKNCSFDIAILSIIPGTTTTAAATGTVQIVNQAIPATDDTTFKLTATVTAATFFTGATIEALHLRIRRVAAAADPIAAVGLLRATLTYGSVRE